jgi:hypothetical protein
MGIGTAFGRRSMLHLMRLARRGGFFDIYDFQKPITGLYLTTLTSNAQIFANVPKAGGGVGRVHAGLHLQEKRSKVSLTFATPRFIEDGQLFLTDRPRSRITVEVSCRNKPV